MTYSEPIISAEKFESIDLITASQDSGSSDTTKKTLHVDPNGDIWTPRY